MRIFVMNMNIINQNIQVANSTITLSIKREDLLHPFISGNKFRKLKYNIIKAKELNHKKLITFGGAFSNHIAAVAFACQEEGIQSIGIIRGDELADKIQDNPTLLFAQNCGMKFEFVSREEYQNKTSESFISRLSYKYGDHYLLPEGGTNELAILGCEEILTNQDSDFDYICCAIGTGGTISGIINSSNTNQKILGFPALKGDFLKDEIRNFAKKNNWDLITDYHFGGYGKVTTELIDFINQFYIDTKIPLDPIYTGKMVYGVINLLANNYFQNGSKILMIHTGGLQGIKGMNQLLEKKKMTKIVFDENE
ncbi:1-aminocyclopropane-1-carboxylate deaminase/D-cysteine desulfhydrase [Flavobacterium sp.]|uniref:1-aminocyclopropane-1-carboxylate deaminase/D-cysteine desulfhydrase n=1 Tax=Flavobacterium sp. TaxID=239 RepID=UPI0038FCE028